MVGTMNIEPIKWRLQVFKLHATNQIDGLTTEELVTMLAPGSGFWLRPVLDHHNLFAAVRSPYSDHEDLEQGRKIYLEHCAHCHANGGHGGMAPNLLDGFLQHGESQLAFYRTIREGIPGTAMQASTLGTSEVWRLVSYLSRERDNEEFQQTPVQAEFSLDVPFQRIVDSANEPANWLTYSGNYSGHRHSTLTHIDPSNVEHLALAWVVQTNAKEKIESSPIVVDGLLFTSLPEGRVLALDAKTGDEIWRWSTNIPETLPVCCGRVNRGVAVLDKSVFVTTLDNRLFSLDANNGSVNWETQVADPNAGYSMTVAPLALNGQIVVGVSGGEFGIRGFVDAYDATSGRRNWRFYSTPSPGNFGAETWSGDSWQTGGGPTWVTGSYDPRTNTLFWGVGNPSPDFDGSGREGDNLFTNSIVALNADTGEYKWHFQFTPHDLHDRAAAQVPILVFSDKDKPEQKDRLVQANRNAFYYELDLSDGSYLGSFAFSKQNWARNIDENGRPVVEPSARPSPKGALVWPGASGATNWWPHSYDSVRNLLIVPTLERPAVFYLRSGQPHTPNAMWLGGATSRSPGSTSKSQIMAIQPGSKEIKWVYNIPTESRGVFGGVMTTASGLSIFGESSHMYILETKTGRELWRVNLGGQVGGPPVSYLIDNSQFITISAGDNIYAFRMSP